MHAGDTGHGQLKPRMSTGTEIIGGQERTPGMTDFQKIPEPIDQGLQLNVVRSRLAKDDGMLEID